MAEQVQLKMEVGAADMVKFWEEKIALKAGEVRRIEREAGEWQLKIDARKEALEKLHKEIELAHATHTKLLEETALREKAAKESSARLSAAHDQKEAHLADKHTAAEAKESSATQRLQDARQQEEKVRAAKEDAVAAMNELLTDIAEVIEKTTKQLL